MLGVEVHDASNTTWLRVEGRFVGAFAEDTKAMVVLGDSHPDGRPAVRKQRDSYRPVESD